MAAPFGGHPTLGKYMAWAANEGCRCQSGYIDNTSMIKIASQDSSKSVIILDMNQSEYLTPSYVSYLDRRLGLNSPFPKAQAGY